MKPLPVLLTDPHALVRAGIRALIDRIEGVEVIGEAGDAREALQLIEELRPALVLLDITMLGMNEVLERSTRQFPEVRIIVLSAGQTGEGAAQALRAGAAGYLPKSADSTDLVDAIATVARGEILPQAYLVNTI